LTRRLPANCPYPNVHGVNECSPTLHETVREAASRGTAIEHDTIRHHHAEVIEGSSKFVAASADVVAASTHIERCVARHQRPGLIDTLTIDEHLARHHPPSRLILRIEESTLDQEGD